MNPEISIKCFCNSILFDLAAKRKYIDLNNVDTVKLIAKCRPKINNLIGYLKKLSKIFKQRKSNQKISTLNIHEVDSINALANKLMKEGRPHELEASLEKINPEELNTLEKESWYHLYGICAFQRNDHEEAMTRFSVGLKQLPNCQKIHFSLGQEFIFLNQPEKAFLEFDKCRFPEIPREYLIRMSNYAYLFNEYQRGINYISQFFPYYFKLKILIVCALYYFIRSKSSCRYSGFIMHNQTRWPKKC
ncbi:MAG: hypothetical protein P4M14_10160 [Gammaproteobacteria bacterium]|nr:hypothetical protein [Gammaproteobacteria bacterium]